MQLTVQGTVHHGEEVKAGMLEAADRTVSTNRKQRDELRLTPTVPGMVPPTVKLGLLTSVDTTKGIFHRCAQRPIHR